MSYRRSRLNEVERLVPALHEHGIPTWQDRKNLASEPTVEAIQKALGCPTTAGAILWLSADVAKSDIILQEEAPRIIKRARTGDGFTAKLCLANSLHFGDAAKILQMPGSIENPSKSWNLKPIEGDPATDTAIFGVARAALARRLSVIHSKLPPDVPLRLAFNAHAQAKPAFELGYALHVDWTAHFQHRHAPAAAWSDRLVPALSAIVDAIRTSAPKRAVVGEGYISLTAAFALGRAFMEPSGISLTWKQLPKGDLWALRHDATDSPLRAQLASHDASAADLAVFVSVRGPVEPAVQASMSALPAFRAVLRIEPPDGLGTAHIKNTEEASAVARLVASEIRKARATYPVIKRTHLFFSGPVGIAIMIGQQLNAVGPVQLYEHHQTPDDAVGTYKASALLCDPAC